MKLLPRKPDYNQLLGDLSGLLEQARRATARSVNSIMTAVYWETGRRIVEFEQGGEKRAGYGEALLDRLALDLTKKFGRGFARPNLIRSRQFYIAFPEQKAICSTASNELQKPITIRSTPSNESISPIVVPESHSKYGIELLQQLAVRFPLSWSHYVLLVSRSRSPEGMAFYHAEALRGGWSVRQLDRQMSSLFYERAALSKNKAVILKKETKPKPEDAISADEEIRDPLVLEFLNLQDQYSESDLEAALIGHLETFLLELGSDFAFVGRQRRMRIGNEWYRVDLLFFHRRLRCLVVIDLKLGKFTHADAGQMHLYLNYAREHWTQPDENPPVGLILCTSADAALAKYALEGLPNKVLAREYQLALPKEKLLASELEATRKQIEQRTHH
jgi:predicted nuclease of restriction endonuclease-like (RecB) superfamily